MSFYPSHIARHLTVSSAKQFRLRPVTIAVQIVLAANIVCAAGYTPHAHAQAASQQSDKAVRNYAIAPGALTDVLTRFAGEAGIFLAGAGQLAQGYDSRGLNGQYTVEGGLQTLLQNTGLQAVRQPSGQYVLQKDPTGNVTLPEVSVQAGQHQSQTVTEGSRSYTTGSMNTATRLALSVRETPQAVTVVSRQKMDDVGMTTLEDVITTTPGVLLNKGGGERPTIYARGFWLQNVMYDGLPGHYDGDYVASPNLAMYDRVEVVRGATGLMTGAGTPSAAINMVRKRPTSAFQFGASASAGSWNNYRTEVDVSGPLNESGSLRGRAVVNYLNKDSFTDVVHNQSLLGYAIVEADLTAKTTLSLGGSYQKDDNRHTWGGIPWGADGSDLLLPRSGYYGYDWEFWDKKNTTAFAELKHQFDNAWSLRIAANYSRSKMEYLGTVVSSGTSFSQTGGHYNASLDTTSYDAYLSGPYTLLGRQHELVVGAGYQKSDKILAGGQGTLVASGLDISNWNPSSMPAPQFDMSMLRNQGIVEQKSTYVTTRLNPSDQLKVILGARLDWYHNDVNNKWMGSGTPRQYNIARNLTRYAGVIYDLNKQYSLYASYTDIFEPQTQTTLSGGLIDPIKGKNYEVGIKGEFFDRTLNASAAIFMIDQENRAAVAASQAGCPVGVTCYAPSGKVRSQGIELEINGALTSNWQLGAGYTYTDARYLKDANASKVGTRFDTVFPEHIFKLSTMYRLPNALHQWRVGGTLQWQSELYQAGTNSGVPFRLQQGAYAVVGVMAGYQVSRNVDVQLNINNLLDKRYYHTLGSNPLWGSVGGYGAPRNFMLTMNYKM